MDGKQRSSYFRCVIFCVRLLAPSSHTSPHQRVSEDWGSIVADGSLKASQGHSLKHKLCRDHSTCLTSSLWDEWQMFGGAVPTSELGTTPLGTAVRCISVSAGPLVQYNGLNIS